LPGGQSAGNEGRRALRKGSTGGLCRGVEPSGDDAAVWHRPTESSARRENVIALERRDRQVPHRPRARTDRLPEGPLGRFTTAASLVHELLEARDEKRLLRLQRQLAGNKLLVGLPRGAREFLLDVLVVGEIYRMSLLE